MTLKLDGHVLVEEVKKDAKSFPIYKDTPPHLAIILVGDNPESLLYIKYKKEAAEAVGFKCTLHEFPAEAKEATICQHIQDLNTDDSVHGILVQLPLPAGLTRQKILDAVAPVKDIDGLTIDNCGRLYTEHPYLVPCTPLGCLDLIKKWRDDLRGLQALIINNSTLVGKPLAMLLLQEGCTVTIAHKHSHDLPQLAQQADILICGVGKAHMIKEDWVKKGACLIDIGVTVKDNHALGDLHPDTMNGAASAVTPTPGGTGPATIAYLLRNLMKAYSTQHKLRS